MESAGTLLCPIECINTACQQPDFIERNGAWIVTVTGMWAACIGGVLTYFLKSRCSRIRCCGVECNRSVLNNLETQTIHTTGVGVTNSNV
jgi:hypothetical protein